MSIHVEAEQAMNARIIPFFEKVTETFSYLVIDPPTQAAAITPSWKYRFGLDVAAGSGQ